MSKINHNWKDLSRMQWATEADGPPEKITDVKNFVQAGCLQRIADSLEAISQQMDRSDLEVQMHKIHQENLKLKRRMRDLERRDIQK
jgi:hypothetical protein